MTSFTELIALIAFATIALGALFRIMTTHQEFAK